MDFTTLYYFKELTKTLNMTETAKKLFISQQALSNRILKLEKECGVKLFYRKPKLALTSAGEFMLEFSNKILTEKMNFNDRLLDFKNQSTGTIKFGASTLRMNAVLPKIVPKFHELYPDVKIDLTDAISQKLEPLVEAGELDLAIVMSNKDYFNLNKTHLMYDQLYICVPNNLLLKFYGDSVLEKRKEFVKGVSVKEFKELPFLVLDNRLGRQVRACFEEANFKPNVYIDGPYLQITTSIGFTGVGAFFNSRLSLISRKNEIPKNMNIFPLLLNDEPIFQNISLISNKERYPTRFLDSFSDMIVGFFANVENEKVARIADYL